MPLPLVALIGLGVAAAVVVAGGGKKRRRIHLGKGPRPLLKPVTPRPTTKTGRLTEAFQVYVALTDRLIQQYGPAAAEIYDRSLERPRSSYRKGSYGRVHGPKKAGVLYSVADLITGDYSVPNSMAMVPVSPRSLDRWDSSPETTIGEVEGLVNHALVVGKMFEESTGEPAMPDVFADGAGIEDAPSISEMAEDWARDEMIGYLVGSIPGGGVILGIGQALGGEGWNYGMATVTWGEPFEGWQARRAIALERAAELIAYAEARPPTGTAKG